MIVHICLHLLSFVFSIATSICPSRLNKNEQVFKTIKTPDIILL